MIRPTLYPTPVPAWDPVAEYERHQPEKTLLHEVVREQLEGFLANSFYRDQAAPRFVEHELRSFLRCGVLAHGFLRLDCDDCHHDNVGHAPYRTRRGAGDHSAQGIPVIAGLTSPPRPATVRRRTARRGGGGTSRLPRGCRRPRGGSGP